MRLNNIISIELEGLSKTIIQYTNNTYIRSYANQLANIEKPVDYEKFELLVDRLYDWYLFEIERIKKLEDKLYSSNERHLKELSQKLERLR